MTELAHAVYGDGPPLVLLHGLFGSARNWTSIARRLGACRRVWAVDLSNHGASPWTGRVDYRDMAARLGDFMAARGIAATAVLGHSMGGKVAMALALEAADAVGALIVVDVAPVATKPTMAPFVDAMRAIPLAASARCAEVGAGLATAVPDDWVRAFLLQNLVADGDGLRWRVNLDAIAAGMDAISGFPDFADGTVYGGPTLFVTGAASDYVRPRHDAVIRRLFPRAETVAIAGHWVHADAPDAFTDTVAGFLESA